MKSKTALTAVIAVVVWASACMVALLAAAPRRTQAPPSSPSASSHVSLTSSDPVLSLQAAEKSMNARGLIALSLIDISHRNAVTDWKAVKGAVDGVYMKATEGTSFLDPACDANSKAALKEGIPIGYYHYFWPSGKADYIQKQADFFYQTIHAYAYSFRPVLDVEETGGLTNAAIIADVKIFAEEFEKKSGQQLMIYCSPNFAHEYLADKNISAYPLWIANYHVNTPADTLNWNSFYVWQYSVSVHIPGITGGVDGDVATTSVYLDPPDSVKQ